MRRSRAAIAVLTIVLISLLVAGPAAAGGPTSVLLVVPGTGQTASLYTGDADYVALAELVGTFEAPGGTGTVNPPAPSPDLGTGVTLTWLMHDVRVWRVDRVYLDAEGGPWISTQSIADGASTITDSPLGWHTAARGKELAALLERLGVGPNPPSDASAATAAAAEVTPATSPRPDAGAREPSTAGLVWGLAGLALGVALTMAKMRLLPTSRITGGDHTTTRAEAGPADWENAMPEEGPMSDELSALTEPR